MKKRRNLAAFQNNSKTIMSLYNFSKKDTYLNMKKRIKSIQVMPKKEGRESNRREVFKTIQRESITGKTTTLFDLRHSSTIDDKTTQNTVMDQQTDKARGS